MDVVSAQTGLDRRFPEMGKRIGDWLLRVALLALALVLAAGSGCNHGGGLPPLRY
jgi:hypothetical protein